ncbi:MAG: endonuclease III [Bacilli bacterium]|nr:endonuclease III [Bacilli bacterium]
MSTKTSRALSEFLHKRFEGVKCALDYRNPFECLVAISLSAQTTDKSVNKVSPILFNKYKDAHQLSIAKQSDVEEIIKPLGLYRNKAKNIISLAKSLVELYDGEIPMELEKLTKLSGVGTKTAGVFLLEIANVPAIPVDTHVHRISDRLGFSKPDMDAYALQKKLEKQFPKEEWGFIHHATIHFGREICHAKNPCCDECSLHGYCSYFKKTSSTKAK